MNDTDLDMSAPGTEFFPELSNKQNSYQGVNEEPLAAAPYNTGVNNQPEAAAQGQLSDKELNFRAMREEIAKMQQEREYWKGQAEAFKSQPQQPVQQEPQRADPFKALDDTDWESGKNVRSAFESLREENARLKNEFHDQLKALEAKANHSDWSTQVTQHVPQLTSKNPIFAEMIRNTSNPYEAAYLLAELNARASGQTQQQVPQEPSVNVNAQRAIANAQKPHSAASIGGQGTLNNADHYASMSDEDFMKIAARNLSGI